MAKVKINNEEFLRIIANVEKTQEYLLKAKEVWETNFDNLYNNFVGNGFLESLYKDAESQYYTAVQTGKNVVCWGSSGAAIGATIGSVVPGIGTAIGALVGAFVGVAGSAIYEVANPREPQWSYVSKIVFEDVLTNCVYGMNDSYVKIVNANTKMDHVYVTLYQILARINEFNKLYAQIADTAQAMNLKTSVASDGVTLLDINTEVVIDGNKVELSVSDAMNAFYTYSGTVISSAVSSTYMEETYGAEINYRDLVKNANSFMTETIQSGLYSQEFVDYILPEYSPSRKEAIEQTSVALGALTTQVESVLDKSGIVLGTVGLFSGLVGASYIGPVILSDKISSDKSGTVLDKVTDISSSTIESDLINKNDSTIKTDAAVKNDEIVEKPSDSKDNLISTKPTDVSKNDKTEESSGNSKESVIDDKNSDTSKEDKEDKIEDKDKEVEDKAEEKVEIVEVTETKLKQTEEFKKIEKDYDLLARMEYEAQDESVIAQKRLELIDEANQLFEMDDKTALIQKLQDFGYSEADINMIIQDRSATMQAIVEGGTKVELAEIANRLAAADGVSDFNTSYNDGLKASDLYDGTTDKFLTITSTDSKVKSSYEFTLEVAESYETAVKNANEAIEKVNKAKSDLESLKSVITKVSGEDVSKWPTEHVEAYNEKANEYNKLVEEANGQIDKTNEAYSNYETSLKIYEQNKINFYKNVGVENGSTADVSDSSVNIQDPEIVPEVGTNNTVVNENDIVFGDFRSTSDEDLLNFI